MQVYDGNSFKYDPFGKRIYKSSSAGTSVFAYDGDNLIEETNSSGVVVARYEDTQNIDGHWLCSEAAQRAITMPMASAPSLR